MVDYSELESNINGLFGSTCVYDCFKHISFFSKILKENEIKPELVTELLRKRIDTPDGNGYVSIKSYPDLGLILMATPKTEPTAGTLSTINGLREIYLSNFEGRAAMDIGTGQGSLSIALAKLGFRVDAYDINQNFLELAYINSLLNGVEDKVTFIQADVSDLAKCEPKEIYDLILSNSAQRPGNENKPDPTKQDLIDKDGLGVIRGALGYAVKCINKNGIIFFQILDWHDGREEEIIERHNLNSKVIPRSMIRKNISEIYDFSIDDFLKSEQQKGIKFSFRDSYGGKLTAYEAMTLQAKQWDVYTNFRLFQLTKR